MCVHMHTDWYTYSMAFIAIHMDGTHEWNIVYPAVCVCVCVCVHALVCRCMRNTDWGLDLGYWLF